jgi:hypothetical protein
MHKIAKAKKFVLPLVMFIPFIQHPAYAQMKGFTSNWVNNQISVYRQHPDWIRAYCYGMRSFNRIGVSALGVQAYQGTAQVDPVVARHSLREFSDFGVYIASNYCPDVW